MKLFQAYYYYFLIFLSLTTSSIAFRYAKPGCRDMCGNVRIPYPFGIGSTCSVNKWYTVDCESSTPYLRALKHLEVMRVDLESQTVTVNTPKIVSDCLNHTINLYLSVDLDKTPFLFSKSQNKFIFEGCGNAVMTDHQLVLTGCSTACGNDTLIDKNNCLGITCCQTTVPYYLKSYNINVTGLERQGGDGACGTAFFVDEKSFNNENFSSQSSNALGEGSFIPISLLWTLSDIDFDQVTCCRNLSVPKKRWKVDTGNGNSVDTWKCYYASSYPSSSYEGSHYLIDGCDARLAHYAKLGCNDMCGKVRIPYPFGIGENCSINEWYIVDCKSSTPYLSAFNNLEVVDVDLDNQTVTVNTPMISHCKNTVQKNTHAISVELDGSPFLFSKSHNKFVVEGCGNAVMMHNGIGITGCSTTCYNDSFSNIINNCHGISCCQTTIPHHLNSYNIHLRSLERSGGDCVSAFLVNKNSYDNRNLSSQISTCRGEDMNVVPTSLLWTLSDRDFQQVTCCGYVNQMYSVVVDLGNVTSVGTWKCASSSFGGNPYLIDGCNFNPQYYMDNYNPGVSEIDPGCTRCYLSGDLCRLTPLYDVDGLFYQNKATCYRSHEKKLSLGVILGVTITIGVFFFVGSSYVLYRVIKKTKERRRTKRFFKHNGGLLLKQQAEADPSLVDKTILFTSHELEKATNNFSENRILGRGGQGTVYKGMLVDGRIVAVKKSKIVDESQLDQFINEVVILSQVNHRNVVKLLGCCLETEVPLLVSEFISNGTLFELLHNETNEFPISLNMRLQIAAEVAGALAYLHYATSIPIYHRDIKTSNILLDDKYRAKVSDFGTSRFIEMDKTHLTTLVKGTFGYLDPEYFRSSQFTEKSDVYSFGVVLVELLTGERPISLTRFGESRSLAMYFTLAMEEGRVMSILDALVIKEGTRDELMVVANLAMRCLNMNGKYRPTMKEVAIELETIRMSHVPTMVETNIGPVIYGEQLSMLTDWDSTSTLISCNNSFTQ